MAETVAYEQKDGVKIKVFTSQSHYLGEYRVEINGARSFYICQAPHGNCQVFSIAHFNQILSMKDDEVKNIIKFIFERVVGKRQVLIDINKEHEAKVESIFKGCEIVFKNAYVSTNESDMIMYLINIDEITGFEEESDEDDDYEDDDDDY